MHSQKHVYAHTDAVMHFIVFYTSASNCRSYNVSNIHNPLFNDNTEDLAPPENIVDYKQHVPVSDEAHGYASISGNSDTIKSNEVSFDGSRVYYNASASDVPYYDTPKLQSKPDATSDNQPTEEDGDYVPPGIIENQLALLDGTHSADGDQYFSLANSQPPAYQDLIGQRPPPPVYTVPNKTPATN